MDFTESHKESSVSIWAFICGVVLLVINLVGKGLKNDYIEEYQIRKVAETFFKMEAGKKLIECENMGIGAMADDIADGSVADGGICIAHSSC